MARYVLDITDPAKQKLFNQLLKELDFVEVVEIFKNDEKGRVALEVMEAMGDVKAFMSGKKKLRPAKELLDEL